MREINLELKKVLGGATFADAVRRSKAHPERLRAAEISETIGGHTVRDGCWEDDRFAILLSDGRALRFIAKDQAVAWQLTTEAEFNISRLSWASSLEPIRLQRRDRDSRILVSQMDRSGIMARIIGRKVRRLGVNDLWIYLHFQSDRRYIRLQGQITSGAGLQFLEWSEDED